MNTIENLAAATGGIAYAVGVGRSLKAFYTMDRTEWIEKKVREEKRRKDKITPAMVEEIVDRYERTQQGPDMFLNTFVALFFPLAWFAWWCFVKPKYTPTEAWAVDKRKDQKIEELQAELDRQLRKAK